MLAKSRDKCIKYHGGITGFSLKCVAKVGTWEVEYSFQNIVKCCYIKGNCILSAFWMSSTKLGTLYVFIHPTNSKCLLYAQVLLLSIISNTLTWEFVIISLLEQTGAQRYLVTFSFCLSSYHAVWKGWGQGKWYWLMIVLLCLQASNFQNSNS